MPLSIYRKIEISEAKTTNKCLQLANKTIKKPEGIVDDILVKERKFIFPENFIVLDFKEYKDLPLILGMPFIYTAKAIIEVYKGTLTLRVSEDSCKFN